MMSTTTAAAAPRLSLYAGFFRVRSQFRHGVVECVYESKPMPGDHKVPGDEAAGRNVL